jgi:hypothetical protein
MHRGWGFGRRGRIFQQYFKAFLRYCKLYPKNSSSLTTFTCLTNTVVRGRGPLPFLLASFLYILLIL